MARAFEVIAVLLAALFCVGLLTMYLWDHIHGQLRREQKQDETDRSLKF